MDFFIDTPDSTARRRKKKVDLEALQSPFSRIPGLDLPTARDLLDCGFQSIDELRGRAPEAILDEVLQMRPDTPKDRLASLRLAVYFAETPEPDPALLHPWKWV